MFQGAFVFMTLELGLDAAGFVSLRPIAVTAELGDSMLGPLAVDDAVRPGLGRLADGHLRVVTSDALRRFAVDRVAAILDAEAYNLDRKQHVLGMIARLNDAFRM